MAKFEEISFTSAHEIKADRRILKTKKAIYEALVELMQKKKLNSITVTELAAFGDLRILFLCSAVHRFQQAGGRSRL